jgi:hypothetical protein
LSDFTLYGLDAAGELLHAEMLRGADRRSLDRLARERLEQWPSVEVWEGPMCLVRLRRPAQSRS